MTAEKWPQLIDGLISKTHSGAVTWSSPTEDTLVVLFGAGAVRITYNEHRYYTLTLLNKEGRVLEERIAKDFSRVDQVNEQRLFEVIHTLWELARRQALKVNDVWDQALKELV